VNEPPHDADGASTGPHEEVGSLGEEAVRLFGALSDLARDATEAVSDHVDTGSAECAWCPVCRTVHAVRQAGPEVRGHLAVAASALLQAAAGVLAAAAPSEPPRRNGFEHIHLDEDPDGDPHGDIADGDGAWPEEDA